MIDGLAMEIGDGRSTRLIAEVQDRVVWRFSKEVVYSTKSFVQVLEEETLADDVINYRPHINTKEQLTTLGIIDYGDNVCALCRKDIETVPNLFVTCEFS
ncbi:hypothetical protein AHAS_Ahas09G0113400 [Arachis hypogaea]